MLPIVNPTPLVYNSTSPPDPSDYANPGGYQAQPAPAAPTVAGQVGWNPLTKRWY